MRARVVAFALTAVVLILLIFSFQRMIYNSLSESAKFEDKMDSGRTYMYVARALNNPQKCVDGLLPVVPAWSEEKGTEAFNFANATVHLEPSTIDRGGPGRSADLVVQVKTGAARIPMRILIENGKVSNCQLDIERARFSLPSAIYTTPRCISPTQTPNWYVRCPEGYFLNREVSPSALYCCPWDS